MFSSIVDGYKRSAIHSAGLQITGLDLSRHNWNHSKQTTCI